MSKKVRHIYTHSEDNTQTIFMHIYSTEETVFISAWNSRKKKWHEIKRSFEAAMRMLAKQIKAGHVIEEREYETHA